MKRFANKSTASEFRSFNNGQRHEQGSFGSVRDDLFETWEDCSIEL